VEVCGQTCSFVDSYLSMDPMFGFCSSEENAFGQPQRAYILSRADRMPQSEDPPRITHVLRPHHIALLSVFVLILRQPVSPKFNLYVWRVLAREIAEVKWNKKSSFS